jgi:hypothetical protein
MMLRALFILLNRREGELTIVKASWLFLFCTHGLFTQHDLTGDCFAAGCKANSVNTSR